MVPGDRPLIAIGHNYKSRNVLSLIATEDAGSTKADITYLSKYPGPFDNVAILPVDITLVMSKLFGYVNEVNCHSKSRQSDLVLEKYWVAQCG